MPARAIASASISFGLVTIPVKLFPATQASAAVSFHLLHKACGSRLKQQYICPREEVIVGREDMVKGYEFARDQHVTFTPDELKALEEKSTQAVEISEFVPLDKIDPVFFDKPYYLTPDKGAEKAYHLLAEVMKETGRSALAKYAARGKQYLVLIRPADKGLVMQQLLYQDEVRDFREVGLPDVPPLRDAELRLAHQLVDQISTDRFEPGQYKDEVKERILADIQRKVEGQQIEVAAPAEAPAQIIDLMEALKASLGSAKGRRGPAAAVPGAEAEGEEAETEADGEPGGHKGGRRPGRAEKATVRRAAGKRR